MAIDQKAIKIKFQDLTTVIEFKNTFENQIKNCTDGNDISKVAKVALLYSHPDKIKDKITKDEQEKFVELVKTLTRIKDETQGKPIESASRQARALLFGATSGQASPYMTSNRPFNSWETSATELIDAVMKNLPTETLQKLIENGADVNAVDYDDNTPLIKAAQGCNADIVITLIRNGADVNATRETFDDDDTPLYSAIRNLGKQDRDYSIVNILVQNGAEFSKLPLFTKFTRGYNLRILCAKIFGDNISNTIFGVGDMHTASIGSNQPTRADSTTAPHAGIQQRHYHEKTLEEDLEKFHRKSP